MKGGRLLKLTLAYDGTDFAGWQRQKNGRSIQGVLEQTFRRLLGQKIPVVGSGRTDAGVHAQGQVAHAVVQTRLTNRTIFKALNALLPEDVAVRSVSTAWPGFHARFGAQRKLYRYEIWNSPIRPVLDRHRLVHIPVPLNLNAMRSAARRLKGRRDFKAFHSSGRPVHSTVRTLYRLSIQKSGPRIRIEVEADGFLYHMVRRIAGLLIEVGKGKIRANRPTGQRIIPPTAPARGLCLVRVRYPS